MKHLPVVVELEKQDKKRAKIKAEIAGLRRGYESTLKG